MTTAKLKDMEEKKMNNETSSSAESTPGVPVSYTHLAGFDEKSIVMATTFSEATEALPSYTEPGCVVLFENDLTDNYN